MKATLLIILCLLVTCTANGQTQTPRDAATRELAAKGLDAGDANAFITAIKRNDLPTTKLFLDAGMSPDVLDDEGVLAIYWAISKNNDAIFDELLRRGANVNAAEKDGDTPLMFAASYGRMRFAQTLLAKGALVGQEDKGGHTPLMVAAMSTMLKTAPDKVKRIFTDGDEDSKEVFASVGGEHLAIMRLLIDGGANVNHVAHDCNGTALIYAAFGVNVDGVKLLLSRGASAKARGDQTLESMIRNPEQMIRSMEDDKSADEKENKLILEWFRQTLKQRREIARLLKNAGG